MTSRARGLHRRWMEVVCGIALVGCGQGEVGGGGIEIPNGLDLKVTASGTRPVAGVQVRLLARDSWGQRWLGGAPEVLDSAVTDSFGQAHFAVRADEGYWVEALSGSVGGRLNVDAPGQRTLDLEPLSSLDGVIDSGGRANVLVRLWGSLRTARTDSQGRFRFDSLPQGSWSLVGRGAGERQIATIGHVEVGLNPKHAAGFRVDSTNIVLDNFADGNSVWALADHFGFGGYWWMASSSPVKGVFGVDGAWQSIVDSAGAWWISAKVAKLAPPNPWANIGLNLGSQTSVLPDFSHATAIRLRVRGHGNWRFRLIERRVSDLGEWDQNLALLPEWSEIVVPMSAFRGEGEPFSGSPRRIREIVFQTEAAGSIEISKVSVEGLALSDWGR